MHQYTLKYAVAIKEFCSSLSAFASSTLVFKMASLKPFLLLLYLTANVNGLGLRQLLTHKVDPIVFLPHVPKVAKTINATNVTRFTYLMQCWNFCENTDLCSTFILQYGECIMGSLNMRNLRSDDYKGNTTIYFCKLHCHQIQMIDFFYSQETLLQGLR